MIKKTTILILTLFFAVCNITAQETPINRFLKIELSEDDYEILNLEDGIQYSIRTETDENSNLVIRVYDENNQPIAEYPGHAVVYPQFDDEAVLGPNTIIVHQKTNDDDLKNLEDDLIVFRISDSTRNYKVGDILFGGISHESPYGYLRKLISQVENDSLMFFYTEVASLLESFDALSIHRLYDYESLIDEETGETRFEQVGVNGVRTRGITDLGEFSFGLSAEIIKGLELDFTFKGNVQLEFVFKAKKSPIFGVPYGVDEFKLVGHFSLDASLGVEICLIDITKELGKKPLPDVKIFILGVPLVLYNYVAFVVKVEAGVEITGGVHGIITTKTGVHYKNGLKGVGVFTPVFEVSTPTTSSLGLSGKASIKIGPEIQIKPYNMDELKGKVNFLFGPSFTLQTSNPHWELSLGGNLNAEVELSLGEFLGIDIGAKYKWSSPSLVFLSRSGNFTPQKPSVNTLATSGIANSKITLRGEVTKPGWGTVVERGFEWGLNTNALTNTVMVNPGLVPFESTITELNESKTYFYRAFAKNSFVPEPAYGAIRSFAVPVLEPEIYTPYNVCTSSAMVKANFTKTSSSLTTMPEEYGFIWTTNSFPPVSPVSVFDAYLNKMSVPVEGEIFSATIDGLDTNTQYYVASYIKYLGKTKISIPDKTIHTLSNESQCVKLTISNPFNVTPTSVSFNVTVSGEPPVVEKGICYSSENIEPTIDTLKISHGSGVGNFDAILDNLQEATRYYVRPYAKIDEKIFYGEVKEKTACDSGFHRISYRDENGSLLYTCAKRITIGSQTLSSGWYSLSNEQQPVTTGMIAINGTVHLILEDSCNWIINGGIQINSGNSLTIYAENKGTGELTANGTNGSNSSGGTSGIGGGSDQNDRNNGIITINGGLIKANGGNGNGIYGAAAGIGGGGAGSNNNIIAGNGGTIIINGGTIIAKGGNATTTAYSYISSGGGGAGIGGGGGVNSDGGVITINGGIVSANGGNASNGGNNYSAAGYAGGLGGSGGGAGIGGGGGSGGISGDPLFSIYNPIDGGDGRSGGISGTITITGGTISAIGGERGYRTGNENASGGGGGQGSGIGNGGGGGGGGAGWPIMVCFFNCGSRGANGNTNSSNIGIGANGGSGGDSYMAFGGNGGSGGGGSTVIINGGSVNATGGTGGFMPIVNSAGQNIYRNTLSTPPPPLTNAPVTAGMINEIPLSNIPNAANGVYGIRDVKTDATGRLYFYLPCIQANNPRIINVIIDGAVYSAEYDCNGNHDDGGSLE